MMIHTRTHSRTRARTSTFQLIVQYLLIAQIGCAITNNKIEQDCHPRQDTQMTTGQGSHWLIESPKKYLCVTRPSEIFVNFV